MNTLPRIKSVTVPPAAVPDAAVVIVEWKGGGGATASLAGWIGTGGDVLAPLRDPALFATARVCAYGSAIQWGEEGGDLAIDAEHLRRLAEEQTPMTGRDLAAWQERIGVSNNEAADMLDVARSTYLAYKAAEDAAVPRSVAIACRAAARDPVVLQAHLRPRGRRIKGSAIA